MNDLTDRVFFKSDYDSLIIMGNDVVPYPNAIDAMIECANSTRYEWICSTELSVKMLVSCDPEAGCYFAGNNLQFTNFTARPWDLHSSSGFGPKKESPGIARGGVRNLCLFKRSAFHKIGYADVNFWPNGYWEDNDFCRRAVLADVKGCALPYSTYFPLLVPHHSSGREARPRQILSTKSILLRKQVGEVLKVRSVLRSHLVVKTSN